MNHSVLFQIITEYFKVMSLHQSGIFAYFLEIGVDTPLSYFVADYRLVELLYVIAPIVVGTGSFGIDNTCKSLSPSLYTWSRVI